MRSSVVPPAAPPTTQWRARRRRARGAHRRAHGSGRSAHAAWLGLGRKADLLLLLGWPICAGKRALAGQHLLEQVRVGLVRGRVLWSVADGDGIAVGDDVAGGVGDELAVEARISISESIPSPASATEPAASPSTRARRIQRHSSPASRTPAAARVLAAAGRRRRPARAPGRVAQRVERHPHPSSWQQPATSNLNRGAAAGPARRSTRAR